MISLKRRLCPISSLLFFATVLPIVAPRLQAEEPKVRVLNLEAAMRTWQERYQMRTPYTSYWYPRSTDNADPGLYPPDCFYTDDLLDPGRAATLVYNLYQEMRYQVQYFVKTPVDGSITDPLGFTTFSLEHIPVPDARNYVEVFAQLVDILQRLNVTALGSANNAYESLGRGQQGVQYYSIDSCQGAKDMIYATYANTAPLRVTSGPIFWQRFGKVHDVLYYGGMLTVKAPFRYDLTRFTGTARHGVRSVVRVDNTIVDNGTYALTEVAQTGTVWTSQVYGWDETSVTALTLDCPASGTALQRSVAILPIMVVRPVYTHSIDDVWTECERCLACAANCVAGTPTFQNDGLSATFTLGKDNRGQTGFLTLQSSVPTDRLATPRGLQLRLQTGMKALRDFSQLDGNGVPLLRQIVVPEALVDVVVLNSRAYELRFYPAASAGVPGQDGFYAPSGTPFCVTRIEDPSGGAGPSSTIRISTTRGTNSESALYAFNASAGGWSLQREAGGLARSDVRTSVPDTLPNRRIETRRITDEAGRTVLHERNTYETFPWNAGPNAALPEELVESVTDPDGAALRTSYTFYANAATDGVNYGKLKLKTEPEGGWEMYEYDSAGRVIRTTGPFLNAAPGATESIRVTTTVYSRSFPNETIVQSIVLPGGTAREVARSYRNFDDAVNSTLVATVPGAGWQASTNLVTTTRSYDEGEFRGRPAAELRPDGTGTFFAYATAADGSLTTTVSVGAVNVNRDAITAGTRTITVTSRSGELLEERTYDIPSGILASFRTVTQRDTHGRATRIDHLGGLYETRTYGCCGLESATDRFGVRTDFTYDVFRRLSAETRGGITNRYTYDAADRRLTSVRRGMDGTETVVEENVYDRAGRLERLVRHGRATTFAEAVGAEGQMVKTTTHADGGTVVETFARDGTLLRTEGTAAKPEMYEHSADITGTVTRHIKVGANQSQAEWVQTHADLAGRRLREVYPDGAATLFQYNAKGQLESETNPDGVRTLYTYVPQGGVEVTALDFDGNGLVDFAGADRITRVTAVYGTKSWAGVTHDVRRAVTEIWATENANTSTTLETVEESCDGLRVWRTIRGLVTYVETTTGPAGVRVVATTFPDGSRRREVYEQGRLVWASTTSASGAVLAQTDHAYDAHGRVSSSTDARTGTVTFAYDEHDGLRSVTSPDPDPLRSGPGYDAQVTSYRYDAMGRLVGTVFPDASEQTRNYYPTGLVRGAAGARTYPLEYTYDPQGRVTALATWRDVRDPSTRAVTSWSYDAARGWLVNKRYADGSGPSYTYTPGGRLKSRTWARSPQARVEYAYNAAGETTGMSYGDNTPPVTFMTDRLGRPVTVTDASGTRTLSYNAGGALQEEAYVAGPLTGTRVERAYDSLLRRSHLRVSGAPAIEYSYDPASRVSGIRSDSDAVAYSYVPSSSRLLATEVRRAGEARVTTTRNYDALDRLTQVGSVTNGGSRWSYGHDFNAANQRSRTTQADGTYWSFGYDTAGQLVAASRRLTSGDLLAGQDFTWSFDEIGNRRSETWNGAITNYATMPTNGYASAQHPDVFDVLGTAAASATVSVSVEGAVPVPPSRQGELYHHRLSGVQASGPGKLALRVIGVQANAGPAGEDAVAEIGRLAFLPGANENFIHDADGNLTEDARWRYTWDAENRLIAVEASASSVALGFPRQRLEFSYDSRGRRFAKKVLLASAAGWIVSSHTHFVHDGWSVVAELDALNGNAPVRRYAWGLDVSGTLHDASGVGGLLWLDDVQTSRRYFAVSDTQGNVVGLFNATDGGASGRYDYHPFGQVLTASGTGAAANPFRFSSRYVDVETGLSYFGARYYQPRTGRWLSRDPLEEDGGANLYAFVENAPTTWIDPLGLALYAFDGTGNNGYADVEKGKETNVFVLYNLYDGNKSYLPGVGTTDGVMNPFGLAFGAGGKSRVNRMINSASKFIKEGDSEIDMVGFSRGAMLVRDFSNRVRQKFPCANLRWMGLFDTVGSFGIPNKVNMGYDPSLPNEIAGVLHLTAGGERRKRTFALVSIRPSSSQPTRNPNHQEVEVPLAVHSDIGGGYPKNRGFANAALHHMREHGIRHGVPFRELSSRYENMSGKPNDSRWVTDMAIEILTGERSRKIYFVQ